MDNGEYFDFCYSEYWRELEEIEHVYRRCGLLLTGDVILASAVLALARIELVKQFGDRFDSSMYCLLLVASLSLLAAAVFNLVGTIRPVKYDRVVPVAAMNEWREKYRKMIASAGVDEQSVAEAAVARETHATLVARLGEATAVNLAANRARLARFERAFRYTSYVVPIAAVLALVHVWLALKGI